MHFLQFSGFAQNKRDMLYFLRIESMPGLGAENKTVSKPKVSGMEDVIRLDRKSFEALAAQSRVKILKSLSVRRKTLSELAKELGLSVSTMKEHLDVLANAGLIIQRDEGRKWKYYDLTRKGSGIVAPRELKVLIMLGISLLLVLGSGWNFLSVYSPAGMESAYGFEMQENSWDADAGLDSPGLEMEEGGREQGMEATEGALPEPALEGENAEGGLVGAGGNEEIYEEMQSEKDAESVPGEWLVANGAEEGMGGGIGEDGAEGAAGGAQDVAGGESVVLGRGLEKEFPYAEAAFFGASIIILFALAAYFLGERRIRLE